MIVVAALAFAVWVYLLAGHGRFWQSGPTLAPEMRTPEMLTPGQPASTPAVVAPSVVAIVPARNEAPLIARTIGSLLAQDYPGPFRIILVDDNSTDGTGGLARALTAPPKSSPSRAGGAGGGVKAHLTILPGLPRPPGWAGKLWAVAQGTAEAGAPEFYLLTDADIEHDPRHLAALVAQAERRNLDLVSEMVALSCESWPERALIPAFVFFFQLLYPFAWVNDPLHATAAAAGGTILIRRRALSCIGGIESIRTSLIDDVALAARVKIGGSIWLGHSSLARSIRPYPKVLDIWRMITRSAYVQLRYSPALLVLCTLGMALVWIVPPLATIRGPTSARILGALAWASMVWSYLPTLRRFGLSSVWAPFLPLVALFYMAATIASAVNHYAGSGAAWKGRAYGAGAA